MESEQGALGSVLSLPKCMDVLIEKFPTPEVFYDLRHQTIYSVMLEKHVNLLPIDIITVQSALKDRQLLDQVGGIPYLNALQDSVHSAAHVTAYAEIVFEKYQQRRLISVATSLVTRAYSSEESVAELLAEAERDIFALSHHSMKTKDATMLALVQEALHVIDGYATNKGSLGGLSTGFTDLDRETDGLHPGDFVVLSAFTSIGKTSLAMNIAEHIVSALQQPVGVFSLEMTGVQLATRLICSGAEINIRTVRDGQLEESQRERLHQVGAKLSKSCLYIDDTSDVSIYQMRGRARRMVEKYGVKAFVVDYLQLMNARGGGRKIENRQQEVSDISSGLKQMAKELGVPVIALSQLNDDGMLRESRAIGMDADGNWNLEEVDGEGDADTAPMRLRLRKNRNGRRDQIVRLLFFKKFTKFVSASKVDDNDVPRD